MSALRLLGRIAGGVGYASRCLAALALGGAIPLTAVTTAGRVLDLVGGPLRHLAAAAAAAGVVATGRLALQALERGWVAFFLFLPATAVRAASRALHVLHPGREPADTPQRVGVDAPNPDGVTASAAEGLVGPIT